MQNTAKLHTNDAVNTTDFVSAAIDGALDDTQFQHFIKNYQHDDKYQAQWQTYHLIGDALRLTPIHGPGIAQRVSTQLAQMPTVLAPQRKSLIYKYTLPIAASIAAVMLVSWSALNLTTVSTTTTLAKSTPVNQTIALQTAQIDPVQLNEYIAAHRDYSPGINSPYLNASYEIPTEPSR